MAELVDVPGLGPGELARGGSSPSIRTQIMYLDLKKGL